MVTNNQLHNINIKRLGLYALALFLFKYNFLQNTTTSMMYTYK
nr:MAG TPA: hypothetical protein [Caudoviricetes sp.]